MVSQLDFHLSLIHIYLISLISCYMSKEVSDAMSQISFAYVHPLLPRSIERNIPMNTWFKRLLAALAVFAVLAGLVQLNDVTKPELVNTDGRQFTKAVVMDVLRDNVQENGSRIGDQIVTLRLADGEEVTANCPNGLLFGTVCEPGMSVIVIASKTGSLASYTVYSLSLIHI